MRLKIYHLVVFITIISFLSCRDQHFQLTAIHGQQLIIEAPNSISPTVSDSLQKFLEPYQKHLNNVLDAPLCYAPYPISATDGRYNSSAGNLLADIVMAQAGPVFRSRTNKEIDFVVLNHGGIRSGISKGKVSSRTAYEVMPFENIIVIVEMKGKAIRDLVGFLLRSEKPHPISGMQIIIDEKDQLSSVTINGQPFDENKIYNVATSNYLFNGGDDMNFFSTGLEHTEIQYLIRNAMIDYFKSIDTLKAGVDDRFIKLETP